MRSAASLTLAVFALLAALFAIPASASAGSARLDAVERSIVQAVNHQRAQHGLGGVRADHGLSRAANFHTRRMLRGNFFAHGAFESRVRRFVPYDAIGETLAYVSRCGHGAAGQIVGMWMNSSGHRAILLSPRYSRIGVGRRTGQLGSSRACVVTADFASQR